MCSFSDSIVVTTNCNSHEVVKKSRNQIKYPVDIYSYYFTGAKATIEWFLAWARQAAACGSAESDSSHTKACDALQGWECLATLHTTDVTLPANPLHVRLYSAHLAGLASSPSVLDAAYYGTKWAHKLCGLPDPTCHSLPTIVMDSARRVLGKPAVAKNPITVDMLKAWCNKFSSKSTTLRDLRFIAMSLVAFAGFLRFNEVVRIRCSDLVFEDSHLTIVIHKSKTDGFSKGTEVVISKGVTEACPVFHLWHYLKLAKLSSDLNSNEFIFQKLHFHKTRLSLCNKNTPPVLHQC